MKITVKRIARRETYTIGRMYVDGVRFCDTIEDKDRGLKQSMSLSEIRKKKIQDKTAIPAGTYEVSMHKPSPLYCKKAEKDSFYRPFCNNMPRIEEVPGYSGILIHPGTDQDSTSGCLIVGENTIVGKVTNSRTTFKRLHAILMEAHKRGEKITITIT